MGLRRLQVSFRFTWLLATVLCKLATTMVNCQMQACSMQDTDIDLGRCFNRGINSSIDIGCCQALNQVVQTGSYNCLCSLLSSSTAVLSKPLLLPLPNCSIYVPSLTLCRRNVLLLLFFLIWSHIPSLTVTYFLFSLTCSSSSNAGSASTRYTWKEPYSAFCALCGCYCSSSSGSDSGSLEIWLRIITTPKRSRPNRMHLILEMRHQMGRRKPRWRTLLFSLVLQGCRLLLIWYMKLWLILDFFEGMQFQFKIKTSSNFQTLKLRNISSIQATDCG